MLIFQGYGSEWTPWLPRPSLNPQSWLYSSRNRPAFRNSSQSSQRKINCTVPSSARGCDSRRYSSGWGLRRCRQGHGLCVAHCESSLETCKLSYSGVDRFLDLWQSEHEGTHSHKIEPKLSRGLHQSCSPRDAWAAEICGKESFCEKNCYHFFYSCLGHRKAWQDLR